MSQRLRVLILADDCNPEWPSLPSVGYRTAKAIAEHADVTVATQVRNWGAIERHGFGRAEVAYLDNEYIARPLFRLDTFLRGGGGADAWFTANVALAYPAYAAFEWEAWKRFRRDLRGGRFDLVHRLTPMSVALPSPMARWSPVPFVLGPLNGSLHLPKVFVQQRRGRRQRLLVPQRWHGLLPFYRAMHESTYRESAVILAAFRHTIAALPPSASQRIVHLPEVGVDPALFAAVGRRPLEEGDRLTFLFAGRLVHWKLPRETIEAFASSPILRQQRLVILGDGPERHALEELVAARGMRDCVEILGHRPQAEVASWMREADVFVFPSMQELGGGVVVEAMASGLCCLVTDYGGPGGLVQGGTGVKIPVMPREQVIARLQSELERLVSVPEVVRELGNAAQSFALRELTWDAKARRIVELYDRILANQSSIAAT